MSKHNCKYKREILTTILIILCIIFVVLIARDINVYAQEEGVAPEENPPEENPPEENPPEENPPEEPPCSPVYEPVKWKRTVEGCGKLCDDGDCPPTYRCPTPLGGARACCDLTNLEPYKGVAKGCYDNIVNVYPNAGGKRLDAIKILDAFIQDITNLQNLINSLDANIQRVNAESYDKMHEAFYVWTDRVGEQPAGHIAYAKIEGLNPNADFKLPYPMSPIKNYKWGFIPQTCLGVGAASGEFTLTVARYDEDTSKTGPLSRFWRFRFGRQGIPAQWEKMVRDEAERFKRAIDRNAYPQISTEETNANRLTLIDILRKYGIVSKVRVNYGPGYTYTPDELKKIPNKDPKGFAAQKNKDIYIKWTSSNFDYNGP